MTDPDQLRALHLAEQVSAELRDQITAMGLEEVATLLAVVDPAFPIDPAVVPIATFTLVRALAQIGLYHVMSGEFSGASEE